MPAPTHRSPSRGIAVHDRWNTHIAFGVRLEDANSGFAPSAFDQGTYERWSRILRGPWRFGYDGLHERDAVRKMMQILRSNGVTPRMMQVYCMIGNEPFEACMQRIKEIHEWGGEPYCQRQMKLNALERTPWIRFDWTEEKLAHVARWVARHLSRPVERGGIPFEDYNPSAKTANLPDPNQLHLELGETFRPARPPSQQGEAICG